MISVFAPVQYEELPPPEVDRWPLWASAWLVGGSGALVWALIIGGVSWIVG